MARPKIINDWPVINESFIDKKLNLRFTIKEVFRKNMFGTSKGVVFIKTTIQKKESLSNGPQYTLEYFQQLVESKKIIPVK